MATALILIDLQMDYFPGGAMELVNAEAAVGQAALLLQEFRRRALPVVHIQHIAKRPEATFFLPETPGVEIHEAVRPYSAETVVTKHFPNSFRETILVETLGALNVSKLVVAGMMTHMCVDTTVRAAADLGFQCSLAQDGCATRTLQFAGHSVEAAQVHLAYMAALSGSFAKVGCARELCAEL